MIRSIILFLMIEANPIITNKMAIAPMKPPITILIEYEKLRAELVPKPPPRSKITNATPRLAPALMPNMPESANGFLNAVWSNNPETAIAPPVNKAVIACGKRESSIICIQACFPTLFPNNISITDDIGMFTEPKNKLKTNNTRITIVNNRL